MKTLIAYRTKYGTTASCAARLAALIGGDVTVSDLAIPPAPDLASKDVVLIGGSIHAGRIQRQVVSFCERNRSALLARPVGLFLCCLYTGEEAEIQMQSAFPDWLLAHAFARVFPGGEIRYGKLTLLDRFLVRALPHPAGDVSRLNEAALNELAAAASGREKR
ncbi:MAG TPA: flavodoxin domain-containing protein [bacterium]|nr:flavodoxin domain-containing protein [bacterium]